MKAAILQSYHNALFKYKAQSHRGYKKGLFSQFRHSANEYARLRTLKQYLIEATNKREAIAIVRQHFSRFRSRFNNHSFNCYFVDELNLNSTTRRLFVPRQWKQPIKFYQGIVYRGTSTPTTVAFNKGFTPKEKSSQIEDYVKTVNYSVGTSTSSQYRVAVDYACEPGRRRSDKFIYVINYQQGNGFDIVKTAKARGRTHCAENKAEINIKGHIPKDNIVGAYQLVADIHSNYRATFFKNPHYNGPEVDLKLSERNARVADLNERPTHSSVVRAPGPQRDFY